MEKIYSLLWASQKLGSLPEAWGSYPTIVMATINWSLYANVNDKIFPSLETMTLPACPPLHANKVRDSWEVGCSNSKVWWLFLDSGKLQALLWPIFDFFEKPAMRKAPWTPWSSSTYQLCDSGHMFKLSGLSLVKWWQSLPWGDWELMTWGHEHKVLCMEPGS